MLLLDLLLDLLSVVSIGGFLVLLEYVDRSSWVVLLLLGWSDGRLWSTAVVVVVMDDVRCFLTIGAGTML